MANIISLDLTVGKLWHECKKTTTPSGRVVLVARHTPNVRCHGYTFLLQSMQTNIDIAFRAE